MDSARVPVLRELLAGTGWVERTRGFGRALRHAPHDPGGLLVVGTPTQDPWHFTAHLDDEARWSGQPNLAPTLVRWAPLADAPAHLAIGLERLEHVRRGETVMVVAPDAPPASLLERVLDARKGGATIFAMDAGADELDELADELLVVEGDARAGLVVPDFEVVTHLVSAAAGEPDALTPRRFGVVRKALARMLDVVGDSEAQH